MNNLELTSQYITQRYLDSIFSETQIGVHDLTSEVERITKEPALGAHLVTPRNGYTHHGIYIGDDTVIHYAGLADGLNSGPVEKVKLSTFQQSSGRDIGFCVNPHENVKRTAKEIVRHANTRVDEKDYNLIWNNCEHFVHHCIYGDSKSYQVNNTIKFIIKNGAKQLGKLTPAAHMTIALAETKSSIIGYIKGDITGKRLIEDINHTAITSAAMSYYGILGQAAIPIPVLGFLIGSSVGFVVGNLLLSSGHLSLGESAAVKASRERYEHVELLCNTLIPKVKASREQLKTYLEQHFADRRQELGCALLQLENSSINGDSSLYTESLIRINSMFGNTLKIKSFQEFDELMLSDDNFVF